MGVNQLYSQSQVSTIGSGYCIDFTPNMINKNYVDLGPLMAIDTGNFSIEMWVDVNACKNDPPFFSNKDWSSGNNLGIVFDVHNNGNSLRVNLKTSASTFQNIIVPIGSITKGWFHLAVTLDRNTYLKVYIDGIMRGSIYFQNGLQGSLATNYTYKLGQDGTGNYSDKNGNGIQYDGKLDEIRVWKTERTETEIRTNMCKKISPLISNLYAYYTCDTIIGSDVKDLTGKNPGKWVKGLPESWKLSGAPIGDTSSASYSEDWTDSIVTLSDVHFGGINIKNIYGIQGIHLYKIKSKPNFTNGLNTYIDNENYYGIYLAGASSTTQYNLNFDYTSYAAALKDEANLKLFTRNQNSDHLWSECLYLQDSIKNILSNEIVAKKGEYVLGNKSKRPCENPTGISMSNQTYQSCVLNWKQGNSTNVNWNTQWGKFGFELGTGTSSFNSTLKTQLISGLKTGSFYEFYIQEICNSSDSSFWVGPYLFYPLPCLSPTNMDARNITDSSAVLTWTGGGNSYEVLWGLVNFKPVKGKLDSTFSDSIKLAGLSPATSYEYYVRANCTTGKSPYNGSFYFRTLEATNVNESKLINNIKVYPNPSNGDFTLLSVPGVLKSSWNKDTKMIFVSYDDKKITLDQIQKKIAAAGYDNEKYKGDDIAYKALPECCQYDRKQ